MTKIRSKTSIRQWISAENITYRDQAAPIAVKIPPKTSASPKFPLKVVLKHHAMMLMTEFSLKTVMLMTEFSIGRCYWRSRWCEWQSLLMSLKEFHVVNDGDEW